MIAKLAWWFLYGQDRFCVKVLGAKYKVWNSWLQAPPASATSFSWRGLEYARVLLSKKACRMDGSRTNILVRGDPWISDLLFFFSPKSI